ncbi:hypothetical protein TNCV_1184671 [Trichonephila clavipes]|nr:hypothetical protein TNCV_1184671 [Trichonephila clavipes]
MPLIKVRESFPKLKRIRDLVRKQLTSLYSPIKEFYCATDAPKKKIKFEVVDGRIQLLPTIETKESGYCRTRKCGEDAAYEGQGILRRRNLGSHGKTTTS